MLPQQMTSNFPASAGDDESICLNIHLRCDQDPGFAALVSEATTQLSHYLPENEVDLVDTHTPHVTVFLSKFSVPALNGSGGILPALKQATSKHPPFQLTTTGVSAQGNYLFVDVEKTKPIADLSDDIVSAVNSLVTPDQPISKWIEKLPEKDRQQRSSMVKRFGSPGVGPCYFPHVTLGYSDNPDQVKAAADALNETLSAKDLSFTINSVSVGMTGTNGTVLRTSAVNDSAELGS